MLINIFGSPKTIAIINLAVQLSLLLAVLIAAYLARGRRQFRYHCLIMRVAVPVQILSIALIMFPNLLGYLERGRRGLLFNSETLIHHSIGLVVVVIFVIVNLVLLGIIRPPVRLVYFMRTAFICWMIAILLGIHLFIQIWL
jgi:hypothetical protein